MKLAVDALALCRSNAHGCLQRLHEAFGPISLHCDILAPAHDCLVPLMVATTLLYEACSLVELLNTVTLRLPSKHSNFSQHSVPACAPCFPVCKLCVRHQFWLQVRQKSSAMMFIELMFWKNASVAEAVRDEYNWRVSLFPKSEMTS